MGMPAAKSKRAVSQPSRRGGSKRVPESILKSFVKNLGLGLITGNSDDDDPSGIETYSHVGAKFGYGLLWTMLLTYPPMAAIQEISARIGRVTASASRPTCAKIIRGRFRTASSSWFRLRMCSISELISGRWVLPPSWFCLERAVSIL
jgi:hypothetical protein